MNKKLTSGLLIIVLMLCLSGCCLSHEWQDATCTEPKTCVKCNETEGVPLGHTWTDATCTAPKVCSVCGEAEGEAIGHSWIDANYQDPKTCNVCGETEGNPLTAAFDEHGLVINAEEGVTYDYVTACSTNESKETIAHITFSDYQISETLEGFDTPEGYEWRTVHVTILVDDENARNYGCNFQYGFTNYYDIEGYEDSLHEEEGNFYYMGKESSSNNYFCTVNFHGTDYSKCNQFGTGEWSDWVNDTCSYEGDFGFCVPIGYDGATLMFFNYANRENGTYFYDKADENTLFFRMD